MCIIKMCLAYWRMTSASGVPVANVIKSETVRRQLMWFPDPFSAIKITESAYLQVYCFEQVKLDTFAEGVCGVDVTF